MYRYFFFYQLLLLVGLTYLYVCVCFLFLTCQRAGVSESPHVRVRQLCEQWDEGVHQVTVKYDAVLTLSHQHRHEVTELRVEPAAVRPGLYQRILHTVLQPRGTEKKWRENSLKGSNLKVGEASHLQAQLFGIFTFLMWRSMLGSLRSLNQLDISSVRRKIERSWSSSKVKGEFLSIWSTEQGREIVFLQ